MMPKRSDRSSKPSLLAFSSIAFLAALALALGGCESMGLSEPSLSSVTTMFDKKQEPLPGRRIPVLKAEEKGTISGPDAAAGPVSLPPPIANASWSQPGGVATNAPGHLLVNDTLHTLWTISTGEGSSKRTRLTAIPIVYNGKIYTMDAEGTVRAFSGDNGSSLWEVRTTPSEKRSFDYLHPFNSNNVSRAGFGGGIAADGGKIYVATGYGSVLALDAGSGQVVWTKRFAIPIREAPTAADGRVFVVNSESELYCLNANDGSQMWGQKGLPENAAVLTSASPAVSGNLVFVPFPSGEITAIDIKSGQPKWTESLTKGAVNYAGTAIGEAARPVVDRDAVFAMSRGGQLVATSREKGERIWTKDIAGTQMPWVAGDTIFVVDMSGKLIALARKDGKVRWVTPLPGDGHWSGPVLAGNRLWLASSNGQLFGVDAVSGTISTQMDLGTPVTITPVVAEGRLYVMTSEAKLIAMN
jgi:outer membrane protein assembly factor BamB